MIPLLTGIRVVELTSVVMGPMVGQILGDLGADVVKVEPLAGEVARTTFPVASPGMSAMYVNNNRNKRGIAVDLKSVEGAEIVRRLISGADVFLHNMRVDAIERLGLGYGAVSTINPGIVYCSAIGYGQDGRYRDRPAFDDVIQAASGFAGLASAGGGDPHFAPTLLADKVGALYAVYGVLAALISRERGNTDGVHVEMGMFEATVAFLFNEHLSGATFAETGEGIGYHRVLSPNRRPHRTRNGWIAVLPYTGDQWARALHAIGRDDLAAEDWFLDPVERSRRAHFLYGELSRGLAERDTQDWIDAFAAIDVPCSTVPSMRDLLDDAHLRDIGFFDVGYDSAGEVCRAVPQPVVFRGIDRGVDRAPPKLGAQTRDVLQGCGFSDAQITALLAAGAVRESE